VERWSRAIPSIPHGGSEVTEDPAQQTPILVGHHDVDFVGFEPDSVTGGAAIHLDTVELLALEVHSAPGTLAPVGGALARVLLVGQLLTSGLDQFLFPFQEIALFVLASFFGHQFPRLIAQWVGGV
jgi:hypothetical protein